MRYKTKQSWIVIYSTNDTVDIYNFSTRYEAYTFFTKIVDYIDRTNHDNKAVFSYNISSSKGDTYYGSVDGSISVRMNKQEFISSNSACTIFKRKEGIELD